MFACYYYYYYYYYYYHSVDQIKRKRWTGHVVCMTREKEKHVGLYGET